MTLVKESALKVVDLAVETLAPNPWNPNRVPPGLYAKLRAYIEREGFVEPLVVRRLGEGYQILGGFHRWMIAKELGYRTVPCVVVDLDDRRAKILSVNLNELKGQSVPALLAELIHDLSRDLSLDDLASQLPYDVPELDDLLRLLQIPDGLAEQLAAEAEKMERERTRILAFALSAEQEAVVEEAVGKALVDVAGTSRGAALTHIAQTYLDGRKG
ncbi:MAG: ParB N-terminal domain-containing protein [bacterium]